VRLREALEETATGALRRMASVHGLLYDDGTTRAELIERLAERLRDPAYLQEQLDGLTADEGAALRDARASGGEQRGFLLDRDHPGAAEALIDRGLLFRLFAAAGPLRGELFTVPDELLALLPVPPALEAPPTGEPPPASVERRASDPAFSLFCIASALRRRADSLEHEVRAWSEEPGGWDWDARWEFLRHLALSAGLHVHQADGALVPGPTLGRLLDDPPALASRLLRTYLRDRAWSELTQAGIPDGDELADSAQLRRALVEVVQTLPEGAWTSFDAFSAWAQRTRPSVVREQLNARGIVLLESQDWASFEHRLLRYVLLGPLYWLGVVGLSADGRHISRRATLRSRAGAAPAPGPAGQSVASTPGASKADRSVGQSEACFWEGVAELVAPARADLGTLLEAERYLVLHERGRPSRYHLVQAHVAAALGSGGSIADGRRLLLKLTRGALPEIVEERLTAWEQRFGALSVRPAVLLEARSAAELDDAIADERVRPFMRTRLGTTVVEVPAAQALELAAALRDGGHLPRVDAALRLSADPRRAYAGLIDEQVLEFLLVSLLAFQHAQPEQLAALEGSIVLLERLERQFPPRRLAELRAAADRLAGKLSSAPPPPRSKSKRPVSRKKRRL
jgi:hypothetical protein